MKELISLPIYSCEGTQIDTLKLNNAVFDGVVNSDAIYQAVNAFRANQRKGLASTKTRGEVSGGGKKPWKQKGTGRARVGSIRSPLWRHGGVIFGPHPRDFYYKLPKKIKLLALKSSLNSKIKENDLIVLDDLKLDTPKTKEAVRVFSNLKLIPANGKKRNSLLLLLDKIDEKQKRGLHNISFLNVDLAKDAHVYDIMSHKKILITKNGLSQIIDRLK